MFKNLKRKTKKYNLHLDYVNAEKIHGSHSKFLMTKICLLEVKGETYFCSVIKIAVKLSLPKRSCKNDKGRYFELFDIFILVSLNHGECTQCAKENPTGRFSVVLQ